MNRTFGDRLRALWRAGETWGRARWARLTHWQAAAGPASESGCVEALYAAEPSRRWQAAAALGQDPMRSPQAVAALVDALVDPEEFVRWQAIEALAHQRGRVFDTLAACLDDSEPLRRAGVAQVLGRLGGEAALQALLPRANDPAAEVRAAVAEALGRLADPAALPALLPLIADPETRVVRAAARALSRLGQPAAAVPLAEALAQPGQPLLARRALAAALADAPHPDAQPQLLAALADPDPQVRGYAASGLGQVGNEAALAALQTLRGDQSRLIEGTVGQQVERALALLDRRGRRAAAADRPAAGAS
ncbi:MAG: putative lyase [Chloroflexi bacterium ADurb.Bin325]|nr:MAG: putative lyase [Chloroflexi bacterium ADurb.Bin325]